MGVIHEDKLMRMRMGSQSAGLVLCIRVVEPDVLMGKSVREWIVPLQAKGN